MMVKYVLSDYHVCLSVCNNVRNYKIFIKFDTGKFQIWELRPILISVSIAQHFTRISIRDLRSSGILHGIDC